MKASCSVGTDPVATAGPYLVAGLCRDSVTGKMSRGGKASFGLEGSLSRFDCSCPVVARSRDGPGGVSCYQSQATWRALRKK